MKRKRFPFRIIFLICFTSLGSSTASAGEGETRNDYDHDRNSNFQLQPDKFKSKLSNTGDLIFGTLLVVFGLISLLGNGCILLIFFLRQRKLSPMEMFLVNLAIVDILLAGATYPMTMIASFWHGWPFGESGCRIYAFLCFFLGLASIFSVTDIALIRYMKTCLPAYGNTISNVTSYKMIAWGYLLALIWAGLPLFGFGGYEREPLFGLSCSLEWVAKDRASQIYLVLVTIFCVLLPLVIIIFSYSQIIFLVRRSHRLVRGNKKGSEIQLSWMSGLITAGFIVGWGPYTVVSLGATFQGEVMLPMWAIPIPVLLAKSTIAYNPIIYFFLTTRYREDFKELLGGWIHPQTEERENDKLVNANFPNKNNKTGTACGESAPSKTISQSLLTPMSARGTVAVAKSTTHTGDSPAEKNTCNLLQSLAVSIPPWREENSEGYFSNEDEREK